MKQSSQPQLIENCTEYMVEQYIDIDTDGTYQYCMEGFIGSRDGKVVIYSLMEKLYFRNKMLPGMEYLASSPGPTF